MRVKSDLLHCKKYSKPQNNKWKAGANVAQSLQTGFLKQLTTQLLILQIFSYGYCFSEDQCMVLGGLERPSS